MSESTRIDAIQVLGRHRKDFGDIEALAASIADVGLLQPVVITPDLRLVAGERRIRAARSLGWSTIPTRVVGDLTDATAALRAERDENTCRKPMTPEELVNIGLEIERLERPKAEARMSDGGRRGAESRWGDGVGPAGPTPSPPTRTNDVVADALGTSTNTYKRAKHVVQTARGDNNPTPEAQEAAQEALEAMNNGTSTITGAYNKVREARATKPTPDNSRLTRPQPPQYGGNRKKNAAVIESMCTTLSAAAMAADQIGDDFDATVTSEEAARLADDLSRSLRSLNRLKQNLSRKATS